MEKELSLMLLTNMAINFFTASTQHGNLGYFLSKMDSIAKVSNIENYI
jgi:uncharacterized protein YejL (UPF0352 family)